LSAKLRRMSEPSGVWCTSGWNCTAHILRSGFSMAATAWGVLALKNSDWESQRTALGETVVKTIAQYAPNLPQTILRHQIITPKDLEETYGLTGGHIFHGELALDQFFTMRPLLDWARYRTPIERLYLCGSGTHPGTGLTGGSGANAAREIVKALKK
jgi:phytoene dehydrogenase-like protein